MLLTDGKVSLAEFEVLACQHFSHSQHMLQEVMPTNLSLDTVPASISVILKHVLQEVMITNLSLTLCPTLRQSACCKQS